MAATLPATPYDENSKMERAAPHGEPPPRRRNAPWADGVFSFADPRRSLADAGAAGRHHRLAVHRRGAGDPRVRPRLPVVHRLGPGAGQVRRPGDDLRHADDLVHRAADRGAGELRHRDLPDRAVAGVAEAPAGRGHRAAGRRAVHRLRHVGPAGVRPHPGHLRAGAAAVGVLRRAVPEHAVHRPAGGHRHPVGRHHPGDHDHPLHRGDDARRLRRHAADAEGVGLRAGLHHLGGGAATSCCRTPRPASSAASCSAWAARWARRWPSPS